MSNIENETLHMPLSNLLYTQLVSHTFNLNCRSQLSALIDFLIDGLSVSDITRLRYKSHPV